MTKTMFCLAALGLAFLAHADPPVAALVAPQNNGVRPAATVPANGPVRYSGAIQDPSQNDPQQPQQQNPLMQMLPQLMQGMGGGLGGGGSNSGSSNGDAGSTSYVSQGKMESCGSIPPTVDSAYKEAQQFRTQCGAANRGDKQKIVVNDYNNTPPTMWIFDAHGNCIARTAVTFGNGAPSSDCPGNTPERGKPLACADACRHLTPPGMHLTCVHNGAKYDSSDSMGLCGLEGQGSNARDVLIHKAANPGTASSFGCSGVAYNCYQTVQQLLGYGALVYNYFGSPAQTAPGCQSKAGVSHMSACQLEPGAQGVGPVSTPAADTISGAATAQ